MAERKDRKGKQIEEVQTVSHDVTLLSADDLYLFNEGSDYRLYEKLGAHPTNSNGVEGTYFAVWAPNAKQVSMIGDFNDWSRSAHPLVHSLHSGWRITLELERGHAYQYRYLLEDREWCNDSNADGYAPNPFGGDNSIVRT